VNIVVYGVLLALILLVPNGLLGDRAILVERM
jgi:branched-chain amino acid transport system permease protein